MAQLSGKIGTQGFGGRRYSSTMKRHPLLLTLGLCAAGAFAQPLQHAGSGADRQAEREQRRAELRTALQAKRQAEAPTSRAYGPPTAGRHLSPRELAEMRQQLRQQQAESQRYRP